MKLVEIVHQVSMHWLQRILTNRVNQTQHDWYIESLTEDSKTV